MLGLARLVAGIGLAVVLFLVLLLTLPIPVPLGFVLERVEQAAGAALGWPVHVQGPARLTLGLRPRLDIRNVRIDRGGTEPAILELGRATLQLKLPRLIGRTLAVREARIEELVVRLDRELAAEASERHAAPAEETRDAAAREPADRAAAHARAQFAWRLDVDSLAIANLRVIWTDDDGTTATVRLDRLDGRLDWVGGVELAGSGGYENHDIRVGFESGSVAALLDAQASWPFTLSVDGPVEDWTLSAAVSRPAGTLHLDELVAALGPARIAGALSLDPHGARPRVAGKLRVTGLAISERRPEPADEAGALLTAPAKSPTGPRPAGEPGRRRDEVEREAAAAAVGDPEATSYANVLLDVLDRFETDLTLEIDTIAGPGPEVRDVSLELDVSDGRLRFPISLVVASIPLAGTLEIGRSAGVPRLAFDLQAKSFAVGELGRWAAPDIGLRGRIGQALVELVATGEWIDELVASTDLVIGAREADLSYGVGEDRRVTFDRLGFKAEQGGPLVFVGDGVVLGERVEIKATGPELTTMLAPAPEQVDAPWPLRLTARGPGLELSATGSWAGPSSAFESALELSIRGDSAATTLRSWVGDLPFPDAPYSLLARLDTDATSTTFVLERAKLGDTSMQARIALEQRELGPHLNAAVSFEYIDLESLLALQTPDAPHTQGDQRARALSLDIPIVPEGIRFVDGQVDLTVAKIGGSRLGLAELALHSKMTERSVAPSPFSFRVHGARFEGSVSADFGTGRPSAHFELGARNVDVGRLLADLGVAEGVDAHAARMNVVVNGRGRSLGDILDGSEIVATIEDAHWTLGETGSETALPFRLERATFSAPEGAEPMRAEATGTLRSIPVRLELETEPLSTRARPDDPLDAVLRLEALSTEVELTATVVPPVRRESASASLTIDGRSTTAIGDAFGYDLPELGAFHVQAAMAGNAGGFALSALRATVGESRLSGRGRLVLTGARPRLDLELESERFQLDDFVARDAPPPHDADSADAGQQPPAPAGQQAARADRDTHGPDNVDPLGPEGLSRYDGSLKIDVSEVRSGRDTLGHGRMHARLEGGVVSLEELEVAVPGGSLEMEGGFQWRAGQAVARAILAISDFDMGVMARRLDPDTRFGGTLSLYVELDGSAPEPADLLAHGNGKIDYAMFPHNLEGDILDLWVVNLIARLLPAIDEQPASQVNCVVAAFDLEDGVLRDRGLLLDTTTMVVSGNAAVDFRDEALSAKLAPQPKRPAMFSLQTRVGVSGKLTDPAIGVAATDAVGTFLGFWTSVVIVPIERLISGTLPADGRETCQAAWRKARSRRSAVVGDGAAGADRSP